ncbi:MAG: phenylalanine--tRNA ligase subunit beta [Abditibacteriota bacterium]|nr:phenylalanine--tRNA ligase subunit beta [Abditibacteriota bacterium]
MKLAVSWLKDFVTVGSDTDALAGAITMNGLEVEESYTLSPKDFTEAGGYEASELCWDVKVTPNRGDWLSILGVAREVAIVNRESVRLPRVSDIPLGECPVKINIATKNCRRYIGAAVKGVTLAPSPDWMANRLIAAGMRPINNVVDITNYVMLELGQPFHAFDRRFIKGDEINIRQAAEGETITTLDDTERVLDAGMMVIADRQEPVALAGIMGGLGSEIREDTVDIFLETAIFDCTNVRRTSKKLNLSTESSYRFERTVDEEQALYGARRALSLILELAGGTLEGGICDVYPEKRQPLVITSDPARINSMLGMALTPECMAECLNTGLLPTALKDGLLVSEIPAYRTDLLKPVDMVEEVGRVFGYDKIGTSLPRTDNAGRQSPETLFHLKLRQTLLSVGGQEILTHSMINSDQNAFFDNAASQVMVRNALSGELDAMRLSLIPNALEVIATNQAHQENDIDLFEIAKVYFVNEKGVIDETLKVSGAATGGLWNNSWGINCADCRIDFFTVKAIVEELLSAAGVRDAEYKPCVRKYLHPTRAAEVFAGGRSLGCFGEASEEICNYAGVRGRAYVYELDFEGLMALSDTGFAYTPVEKFPAITRDVTVVLSGRTFDEILKTAWEAADGIVKEISLKDVFESEKLGKGNKSYTLQILMRADRTLTDTEANEAQSKIKSALEAMA